MDATTMGSNNVTENGSIFVQNQHEELFLSSELERDVWEASKSLVPVAKKIAEIRSNVILSLIVAIGSSCGCRIYDKFWSSYMIFGFLLGGMAMIYYASIALTFYKMQLGLTQEIQSVKARIDLLKPLVEEIEELKCKVDGMIELLDGFNNWFNRYLPCFLVAILGVVPIFYLGFNDFGLIQETGKKVTGAGAVIGYFIRGRRGWASS